MIRKLVARAVVAGLASASACPHMGLAHSERADGRGPVVESPEIAPRLRSYFGQQAESGAFSGAVLVARRGEILFQGQYGLANRETGARNSLQTRFNMASLGKMLTQVAIMQLAQAGRINLDDTVGRYLPDYPNEAVRDRVTVRQLYNMRSGVGSYWNDRFAARRARLRTIDDYLALFATDPLAFEPGTSTLYSNGGYIILGKIIEAVSGLSYGDYVARNITGPARMSDTGFFALDERVSRLAIGYTSQTSMTHEARPPEAAGAPTRPLRPNTNLLPGRGLSAGGGYSSVGDFYRFDQALRNNRLLNAEYGARLLRRDFGNRGVGGFAGGYAGANTAFIMYGSGTTIIVFANQDPPAAVQAAAAVAEMLGERAIRMGG